LTRRLDFLAIHRSAAIDDQADCQRRTGGCGARRLGHCDLERNVAQTAYADQAPLGQHRQRDLRLVWL
jgi:hypothetical protein